MPALIREAEIRSYNLFGEHHELPDVVHCETIEQRSRLHNWEFVPHRHARLHQVLLLDAGGGEANLDGRPAALGPGVWINVPAGVVHAFRFTMQTRGWVVTLASELLDDLMRPGEGVRPWLQKAWIGTSGHTHRTLIENIFHEYEGQSFGRAHQLRAMAGLLLGEVARSLEAQGAPADADDPAPVLTRFDGLLETHFRDHLGVADYAAKLGMTPTHLSRCIRAATGQPASQRIRDRLVREARRQLAFTNLSVAEIAYLLGYADPAYFTRVFTRGTGLAPTAFRARLDARR